MSESRSPQTYAQWRARSAAWVAFGAFALVLSAVEAMAVRGQLDFGSHVLHLVGWWLAVPPVALEAGALTWAALALWSTLTDGDSAFTARLMTAANVAAAAAANWLGAIAAGRETTAAVYLAGASLFALAMWNTILRRVRRSARGQAAVKRQPRKPLPRFRLVRWLVDFDGTWKAWKLAVKDDITADEALSVIRLERAPLPPAPANLDVDLTQVTKREAVEYAASVIRSVEPSEVRTWLGENGVKVDKSYTAAILRDLAGKPLRALPGGAES